MHPSLQPCPRCGGPCVCGRGPRARVAGAATAPETETLDALRRTALLVRSVGDLGATIRTDGGPVRVARRWDPSSDAVHQLTPERFARCVSRSAGTVADEAARLLRTDGPLRVELFAGSRTRLGPFGLVRHEIVPGRIMLGFATTVGLERAGAPAAALGAVERRVGDGDVAVVLQHDDDLATTFVHALCQRRAEPRTFEVIVSLAAAYGVEQLEHTLRRHP